MDYLSKRAEKLTPYIAGEQPKDHKYIKLNTNENPYPPSPKIYAGISGIKTELALYPDPDSCGLCAAIAASENVGSDSVFCGNGSDEVLSFAFAAFFDDDLPLLFPDITYSFYPVFARFYDIPTKILPLNENFEIEIEDYFQAACGVIFPNPNAPTGVYLKPAQIIRLLEYDLSRVVVIDEAYIAFGGQSMVPYIDRYPNLLVVRTFSKSHSLAGMRIGYAIGQPHLIEGLKRVKDSFNSYPVDRIASAAAAAAVADIEYYQEINAKIAVTRERFSAALTGLGFFVLPSKANFILASPPDISAKEMFRELKELGVLVRYFSLPRIDRFLRITIGTDEDMDRVTEILRNSVRSNKA